MGGKNCCTSTILAPRTSALGIPERTDDRASDVDSAINNKNITSTIKVVTSILVLNIRNLLLFFVLNLLYSSFVI